MGQATYQQQYTVFLNFDFWKMTWISSLDMRRNFRFLLSTWAEDSRQRLAVSDTIQYPTKRVHMLMIE